MIDRFQLAALAAVIRKGSFEKAAQALHVTPSAISQRIKTLEDLYGAVLVLRDSPCRPTKAGEKLFRHALQVELLEHALSKSAKNNAQQSIALAVNADSLATWFIPAIKLFNQRTGATVELQPEDENYTADWLRNGRVLAAVGSDPKPVQGCKIEYIGTMTYIACATPEFKKKYFPKGLNAKSCAKAPTFVFSEKDRMQHDYIRKVTKKKNIRPPVHQLPSTHAFFDGVCMGLGWTMKPKPMVAEHLKSGKLVALSRKTIEVKLYWQHWRLDSELLQELTKAVREAAKKYID